MVGTGCAAPHLPSTCNRVHLCLFASHVHVLPCSLLRYQGLLVTDAIAPIAALRLLWTPSAASPAQPLSLYRFLALLPSLFLCVYLSLSLSLYIYSSLPFPLAVYFTCVLLLFFLTPLFAHCRFPSWFSLLRLGFAPLPSTLVCFTVSVARPFVPSPSLFPCYHLNRTAHMLTIPFVLNTAQAGIYCKL